MIKGILINTETNTQRETAGSGGITATIDLIHFLEGEGNVDIHIDFDKDENFIATIKEILKFMIEKDRKAFAQAVYQAAKDKGLLHNIDGIECLIFNKKKK